MIKLVDLLFEIDKNSVYNQYIINPATKNKIKRFT